MKILLAIFLPPVAVILCGRPLAAVLNFFLCILFWIPGMIHAIYIVMNHDADTRVERLAAAMGRTSQPPR